MMNLKADELLMIRGGGKKGWGSIIFLVLGGLITLITGIIDGMTNPSKCNN